MKDKIIYLLGYKSRHTHTYPQFRFNEVLSFLGYGVRWVNIEEVDPTTKNRIFICWDQPNSHTLVQEGHYKSGDIILQKVTALVPAYKSHAHLNWGGTKESTTNFLRSIDWSAYQMIQNLLDDDINIYGFGCKTAYREFPKKFTLVTKLLNNNRLFYHPWGPCLYDKKDLDSATPITNGFEFDIGYVGSIWGIKGRGNVDTIKDFLIPLLENKKCALGGRGTPIGAVTDEQHKHILKSSKLCPIVNALIWNTEKGIQDRFWTVFASGRFGVVDNEGVYDFFDKDEVVCSTDPEGFIEKSEYYLRNPEKQLPYIEKVLSRIKSEYNWYNTWSTIMNNIK